MNTEIENTNGHQLMDNKSTNLVRDIEPWPEPVTGAELLDDLTQMIKRYVVLPSWGPEALALWTLHTYAYELRDVTAYVGIESPEKRCGKTTLLGVLAELVNRPVVAANISSPAFFRVIEETRPTLLIDEADTFLQGNDELRGILNSGYSKQTAFVVRVLNQPTLSTERSDEHREPRHSNVGGHPRQNVGGHPSTRSSSLATFTTWCPKAVAAIGRLPETLADRCIVVRMHRKKNGERCDRLKSFDGQILRRKCARFIADHANEIKTAHPRIPEGLNDRAADIWEPLLALADLSPRPETQKDKPSWSTIAREAATALTASTQQSHPIGSLLLDITFAFVSVQKEKLFSRDLIEHLNSRGLRPWTGMFGGRELTEITLARVLRTYGVRPRTVWIDGECAKGYFESDFTEITQRYVTRAELET